MCRRFIPVLASSQKTPTSPKSAAVAKSDSSAPRLNPLQLLGSKLANQASSQSNVKCRLTPGSDGPIATEAEAMAVARKIGYPVIIKASAGGGGRGIRLPVAHNDISLKSSLTAAQTEAEKAFKDGTVFIEKFHENPRHVEVQLLGDKHGNVVHLFERDCTLQRAPSKTGRRITLPRD